MDRVSIHKDGEDLVSWLVLTAIPKMQLVLKDDE